MDYFEMFNEVRRPALDDERLKKRFTELSVQAHPDRIHGGSPEEIAKANERSAELNAAYNCLREPRDRIFYLLKLEAGRAPTDVGQIPENLMNLFVGTGELLRKADVYLVARAKASSPLVKAKMFPEGAALAGQLQTLVQDINARRTEFLSELEGMNEVWIGAPLPGSPGRPAALPLGRLEEIYRYLSFFGRWSAQIQERSLRISFPQ
jgi:hypothetical protein